MLNLTNLKYFFDAAMAGSLSEAALVNRVSQSAISQAIKKLEDSLGLQLCHHKRKHFLLTDHGRRVLRKSEHILRQAAEFENSLTTEKQQASGEVRLACSHSIANSLFPGIFYALKEQHPLIRPHLEAGNPIRTLELLRRHLIDFAIILDNISLSGFTVTPLMRGNFQVFQSKKRSLSNPDIMTWRKDQYEVVLLIKQLRKLGIALSLSEVVNSWEVIATFTQNDLGMGFFPDYILTGNKFAVEPAKDVPVCIPYQLFAVQRKNEPLSQGAGILLELIKKRHPDTTAI